MVYKKRESCGEFPSAANAVNLTLGPALNMSDYAYSQYFPESVHQIDIDPDLLRDAEEITFPHNETFTRYVLLCTYVGCSKFWVGTHPPTHPKTVWSGEGQPSLPVCTVQRCQR